MVNITPIPIVLIILDGWGLAGPSEGNAVTLANTPNMNFYYRNYPNARLQAAGEAVGLPRGEDGNSETGHINIGAGSVIFQTLPKINMSIADGSFFNNKALEIVNNHLKINHSSLHLLGLIGAGGVHSNIEHLFALLRWAKEKQLSKVYLHLFTDGRDSSPFSSLEYLNLVEEKIKQYNIGQIATLMGRFYAMDRDNRWERTKVAYNALTEGEGLLVDDYHQVITDFHNKKVSDEFLKPIIIKKNNYPNSLINDNDAIIFFNFRIDRPRELTKAFVLKDFENLVIKKSAFDPYAERYGQKQYWNIGKINTFQRNKIVKNLCFVTMTEYEPGLPIPSIFAPNQIEMPLPLVLSNKGLKQLKIAETEKERHVTYYFNGKREDPLVNEDRFIISSPQVRTYDLQPEMSAYSIADNVIKSINQKQYNFILVNFANPDMVGHTGILKAGIKACETVDNCLGKIVPQILSIDGVCLITADHGNVEEMIDLNTGAIDTKHSTNDVPFILVGNQFKKSNINLSNGILADIAPTILKLLNIEQPVSMLGKSLL